MLPTVGTIMYVPESEKTPYGYLGKITRIENNNGYKVFTESVALDEVFENLSVNTTIASIEAIDEVQDGDGNPIEYEIVDTMFQETGITNPVQSRTGSFYLKDKLIRFPFKIYEGKSDDKSIEISGNVYAGIKTFNLSIDINNNKLTNLDLDLTPCLGLSTTSHVKLIGGKLEAKDILIGKMTFRVSIPTPVGIPIILPISMYIYGTCGASGELTASLDFNPEFAANWNIRLGNGQPTLNKKELPGKNPWGASEFEVKGELYSGTKFGILVGLYSATTGIGINMIPKYSISCSASIKAEDIMNINPLVDQTLKISSEAYCVAKLFGKSFGKLTAEFPEYILWNEKEYLLPQYSEFTANGYGTHGNISYKIDQHYFLDFLGFKPGLTIFDSNQTTEIETAYPTAISTDKEGFYNYKHTTKELTKGKTYYASPTIYGLKRKYHGEKHEFVIEVPNICGDWKAVWHTTPPNAKLLTMSLSENNKCTQTYYYANRGENVTYTCDYSYKYPTLILYKDNGDTQYWEISEFTETSMTLKAADGFCYYLSK